MRRFKIFTGNLSSPNPKADEKANKWLDKHPEVDVLAFEYQQARMGDHSICIWYEEAQNDERSV